MTEDIADDTNHLPLSNLQRECIRRAVDAAVITTDVYYKDPSMTLLGGRIPKQQVYDLGANIGAAEYVQCMQNVPNRKPQAEEAKDR